MNTQPTPASVSSEGLDVDNIENANVFPEVNVVENPMVQVRDDVPAPCPSDGPNQVDHR
jgi:hypothetical protein